MRHIPLAIVLAAVSSTPLWAQAQDTPTFRSGTTLVEFTVVALDDKGNPITDLSKDDLLLTDRGQPREIAFFRFDGGAVPADAAAPPPPLPAGFVSNRPEYQAEPQRNVTAIVLDLINTAPPDQNGARSQLLQYLKELPSNTPVGVFQFADNAPMRVLQPFTNRVELVRSRMASLESALRRELVTPDSAGAKIVGGECAGAERGGPVRSASTSGPGGGRGSSTMAEGMAGMATAESNSLKGINESIRTVRLSKTIASLEALGDHLAAIPGRKNLVLITSGMPIRFLPTAIDGKRTVTQPLVLPVARRLANQGVAVYPVDAKGGCRALDTSKTEGPYGANDPPWQVFDTFNVLADVTGGRVVKYENDLSQGVVLAAKDLRGTYTVGFYASDEPDDRWHPLEVTTKRRGARLRHRQGYLSVARVEPQSLAPELWGQLAQAPLLSSSIRLNGRTNVAANKLSLMLQIAAGDLYFRDKDGKTVADLEIGVVEKTAAGPTNIRQQLMEVSLNAPLKDRQSQLIAVPTSWAVNAGTSAVRVIVRDRFTGRYGTLDISLVAGK
jgi:VWFA-related protein